MTDFAQSQNVIFSICAQKPSADGRKNLPPTRKSCFQLVQTSIDPTKKIWIKNLVATLKKTVLKMLWWNFGETGGVAFFRQNAKNRSFFELQRDFWFKSFLNDHKHTVLWVNIWFLVIARHCCSLLLIFRHFRPFRGSGKIEENSGKWTVVSTNDEQWRAIKYLHKVLCICEPLKKIWIENLVLLKKTSEIGVFASVFGEKLAKFHQKKCKICSFSQLQQSFWLRSFYLAGIMF